MFRTYKYNNYKYNNYKYNNNTDNIIGVKKEIRSHIQKSIQLSMERMHTNQVKRGVDLGGFKLGFKLEMEDEVLKNM